MYKKLFHSCAVGWLAWERFRCNIDCTTYPYDCIKSAHRARTSQAMSTSHCFCFCFSSENLFMDMADRLVEDGYRDVGYEFVNIDVRNVTLNIYEQISGAL